jgi:hypothetical protein
VAGAGAHLRRAQERGLDTLGGRVAGMERANGGGRRLGTDIAATAPGPLGCTGVPVPSSDVYGRKDPSLTGDAASACASRATSEGRGPGSGFHEENRCVLTSRSLALLKPARTAVRRLPAWRRRVGASRLPQRSGHAARMVSRSRLVGRVRSPAAKPRGRKRAERPERAARRLRTKYVRSSFRMDDRPHRHAGGDRQRAAIWRRRAG